MRMNATENCCVSLFFLGPSFSIVISSNMEQYIYCDYRSSSVAILRQRSRSQRVTDKQNCRKEEVEEEAWREEEGEWLGIGIRKCRGKE